MNKAFIKKISVAWILLLFATSCNLPYAGSNKASGISIPEAEVVFQVAIPEKIQDGSSVYLEFIDEVTGIYFNPTRYEMNKSSDVGYLFRLPLPIGSTINYRYIKIKDSVISEFNSRRQPVLSRQLVVDGPVLVQDIVSGWADSPFVGTTGKVSGQVIDDQNNAPIPDLLVSIAGIQTTTLSDGSFIIPDVPVGVHSLVVLSKDGSYSPFQQYAKVAEHATTPVMVHLNKRDLIEVTFKLSNAELADKNIDVRMAGNISQLGNRFTPLLSGSPDIPSELPVMTKTGRNTYSSTISLPVGAYVKYKYTLGDGFWNSETDSNGGFRTRDFIVPNVNTTIVDKDVSFNSIGKKGIVFHVNVPKDTPSSETIFIQFNPFDWMEPIPMKKTGENSWEFTLISPLNLFTQIHYRYCRNGDCENGLSINPQFTVNPQTEVLIMDDIIDGWVNFSPVEYGLKIDNGGYSISPNPSFITGVELTKQLPSTWQFSIKNGIDEINNLGANWVILSPKWVVSVDNSPIFDDNSKSLNWSDEQKIINYVKSSKMETVLFPEISLTQPDLSGDNNQPGQTYWDQLFSEQYKRFLYHNADLAQIMGVKAIIIGDPSLYNLLEIKKNIFIDWVQIIEGVKQRFSGEIIGVVSIPSTDVLPVWLKSVDKIYVLFSPTIIDPNNMISEMSNQLDSYVLPVSGQYNKQIILGANFASNTDATSGCVDTHGSCSKGGVSDSVFDAEKQASLYNALSVSAFTRPWISGLISRNYYPFLALTDPGSSPYGKPANNILWFWFHFIRNLSS